MTKQLATSAGMVARSGAGLASFVLGLVCASFLTLSQARPAAAAAVVNAPRPPAIAVDTARSGAAADPGALQPGGGWVPDGKGGGLYLPNVLRVQPPVVPSVINGISYHGGPVMLGTTHVYYIWYGNWSSNSATTILADFAKNIGGSPYYNINTGYSDGSNNSISNSVTFGGAVFDSYSQGATITDAKVLTIVQTAINNHSLPLDHQGVYFVLTSADVVESDGFCTVFCGWHSFDQISSVTFQYSFVGNSDSQCPGACQEFPGNTTPNGNSGADGMASIIAHELDESVTDPQLNAWFDDASGGQEVGDKCNFMFGPDLYLTPSNAIANIRLGLRDYLIQEDWVNASGGFCAMALPQPTKFFTVTPCRVIDTRNPNGPLGGPALQASQTRAFALAGACGVPATAKALALNLTITQPGGAGFLTLFAADQQPQGTSDINFAPGQTRANNAVLRLSGEGTGSLSVATAGANVHFILDVVGYFQ